MSDDHLISNIAAVPLYERAAEEAALALAPYQKRHDDLLAALAAVDVKDDEDMKRAVDKIALARALRENADALLQPIGLPYQEAAHAVRVVAVRFLDPLRIKERDAQRSIEAFRKRVREAAAIAANEQAAREAELRKAAGLESGPVEQVRAADVRLPSARSDYRGQVFDRKVIHVRIVNVRALPDDVLNAPGVLEALERAVRVKAKLTRDIPGAEITDDLACSVKAG
jgi:hypothetical protein